MAADSNSVSDQRRRQASWRPWSEMLDGIQEHHVANHSSCFVSNDEKNNKKQEEVKAISCVDVGCGTGEVMRIMSDRGWNVMVGIDRDADISERPLMLVAQGQYRSFAGKLAICPEFLLRVTIVLMRVE